MRGVEVYVGFAVDVDIFTFFGVDDLHVAGRHGQIDGWGGDAAHVDCAVDVQRMVIGSGDGECVESDHVAVDGYFFFAEAER